MCEYAKKYKLSEVRSEAYWVNYWIEEDRARSCVEIECEPCRSILIRRNYHCNDNSNDKRREYLKMYNNRKYEYEKRYSKYFIKIMKDECKGISFADYMREDKINESINITDCDFYNKYVDIVKLPDYYFSSLDQLRGLYNKDINEFMFVTRDVVNKLYIKFPPSLNELNISFESKVLNVKSFNTLNINDILSKKIKSVFKLKEYINKLKCKNANIKTEVILIIKLIPISVCNIISKFLIL